MGPLKLVRRQADDGRHVISWEPVLVPWEFTEADVIREAEVLDDLAEVTAATDPWTAATQMFGGRT
jgi:hypothetical protein